MPQQSGMLKFSTQGGGDTVDLTAGVESIIATSGIQNGVATIFAVGSTAAITTIEYEPGAVADLAEALDRLLPADTGYAHNRLNHDDNAHAHLRASIIGPSETIPIGAGKALLGTWQQVVLIDFDTRPRERTVVVQVA